MVIENLGGLTPLIEGLDDEQLGVQEQALVAFRCIVLHESILEERGPVVESLARKVSGGCKFPELL